VKQTPTRKRKATPASVNNLRRSKRGSLESQGFNPASPAMGRARLSEKRAAKSSPLASKSSNFFIAQPEFPDLAFINECFSKGLPHPYISISELQRVAVEICGVPPLEVANEQLMKVEAMEPGKEGPCSMVVHHESDLS
jgi:hypothetical protein